MLTKTMITTLTVLSLGITFAKAAQTYQCFDPQKLEIIEINGVNFNKEGNVPPNFKGATLTSKDTTHSELRCDYDTYGIFTAVINFNMNSCSIGGQALSLQQKGQELGNIVCTNDVTHCVVSCIR